VINKHQEWQDLVPFYVAQSLSAEQVRQFETHLASCKDCQAEIDDWRMIASAVWRDTDEVARQLPALSQEVYNRLNYRDRAPVSRYSANPPRPQPPQAEPTAVHSVAPKVVVLPKSRRVQLPITMVAGLLVAVIFGGVMMMFALRSDDGDEVALNLTLVADTTDEAGVQADAAVTSSPTQLAIIPTQDPSQVQIRVSPTNGVNDFNTNTPEPSATNTLQATNEPSNLIENTHPMVYSSPVPPSPTPDATLTPTLDPFAPLGGGPYMTIEPSLDYCEAFNPSTVGIEVYERADWNSQITGILVPGSSVGVISVSENGWYFLVLPNQDRGWLPHDMAYLRGSCYAGYDVPFATPTYSPEATNATTGTSYEQSSGRIVVINAAYADLQTEPNFTSAIIGVVSRNEQFQVLGYEGTGSNRFVNIVLPDGRTAWVWAQIVNDYAASDAPPPPTPQQ
jgi:hypothetical protein